jgi:hypothetical protein
MSWDAAEGFYVWRFSPPASMWTYVGSAGVVVVTLGCCMFPLSPPWVKVRSPFARRAPSSRRPSLVPLLG